jgi:hypothetical protein
MLLVFLHPPPHLTPALLPSFNALCTSHWWLLTPHPCRFDATFDRTFYDMVLGVVIGGSSRVLPPAVVTSALVSEWAAQTTVDVTRVCSELGVSPAQCGACLGWGRSLLAFLPIDLQAQPFPSPTPIHHAPLTALCCFFLSVREGCLRSTFFERCTSPFPVPCRAGTFVVGCCRHGSVCRPARHSSASDGTVRPGRFCAAPACSSTRV